MAGRPRGRAAGSGGEVYPCPLGCSSTSLTGSLGQPEGVSFLLLGVWVLGRVPQQVPTGHLSCDSISKRLPESKCCPREGLCGVVVCPDLALGQQVQSPDADYKRLGPGRRGELSGSPSVDTTLVGRRGGVLVSAPHVPSHTHIQVRKTRFREEKQLSLRTHRSEPRLQPNQALLKGVFLRL